MSDSSTTAVSHLLGEVEAGRREALDELFPIVYGELRAQARRQRGRWQGDYTLDTTSLVHEVYIKLVDQERVTARSRAHFVAVAAKAMRHILCNHARDRQRQKRGGGAPVLSLDDSLVAGVPAAMDDAGADTIVALERALERLEQRDPRQVRVVECRFFGGLSIEDTADALALSPATVKRDWSLARAWLYRELQADQTGALP